MNETTVEETATLPEASNGATFDSGQAEAENTPEPAGALTETQGESETPPAEDPGAKHNKVQQRINEVTAARRQAEREAEYWKEQAMGTKPQEPEQPAPAQQGEPRLEDFNEYDDYLVAKAKSEMMADIRRQQERVRQQQIQQQHQKAQMDFNQKANELRAKYEDFDLVAFNPQVPINQAMEQVILSDDKGPDIAYYLGNNIQEAQQIAQMPPVQAVMKLAEIKGKLTAPPPTTTAPDPASTVGSKESEVYQGPAGATFE